MSYGGELHFGLIADRQLVPDLDRMASYLADELAALKAATVPDVVVLPETGRAPAPV